jgi:predicted protein tyrosine phosphatase
MVKIPYGRIAIFFLCAVSPGLYGSGGEKAFPKPSFFEVAFYHVARSFDRICTSKWVPRNLQRDPFVEMPLAQIGISAANVSLVLGMQPDHHMAEKILSLAHERSQQLFTLSLLAPFEAKFTSSLMAEGDLEVISARDNIALSVQAIDTAVRKIEEGMTLGNRMVYVHCKSGIGRSATVVAAYLLKHGTMSNDALLALLKQLRPHTGINRPRNFHYIALQAWREWTPSDNALSPQLRAKKALLKIIALLEHYHKAEVVKKPWEETLKVLVEDLWQQSSPGTALPKNPRDLRLALEI